MAETLGSMVDKLTIRDIREFHLLQMLESGDEKFTKQELKAKLDILAAQKKDLIEEIERYVFLAQKGGLRLRDEKLKLYNARKDMGRILQTESVGEAVSGLAKKNLELWHLEDEARRKDVTLAYIGGVKKKIDLANQQRNDFMDKIDELFEKKMKTGAKSVK